jgi:putative transposase
MLPFVQVRYRYRLNPTPGQRIALSKAFGCARVVFNDGLRLREQARLAGEKYVSNGDVQRAVITAAKKTPERAWLREVSSVVLVQAVNDLHRAYGNFFESLAGKRKGRKMGALRFRPKRGRQSIRLTREGFKLRPNGRLYTGSPSTTWRSSRPPAKPRHERTGKDHKHYLGSRQSATLAAPVAGRRSMVIWAGCV